MVLPCCGVDEKLHQTVDALRRQAYRDYHVIFTFESMIDPAYAAVGRWTQDWVDGPKHTRVVAGYADQSSQKIRNLLAAVAQIERDREVIAFLDSDAVPNQHWLAHLVAPLQDPSVGAASGFRWYTAGQSIASGIRSAWNAASISFMHSDRTNICWGGSTAVRRETFERLEVARHWAHALSDDYQMTRCVRGAGLRIRFVPQALVPSSDDTTLRGFFEFARRQLIITRICAPEIWSAGFLLCCNFMVGTTLACLLFVTSALGIVGDTTSMLAGLAGWMFLLSLASGKCLMRQLAVRQVLRYPAVSWRDMVWDVLGIGMMGSVHFALFALSAWSRRFAWRNTEYEMISPDETRVIRRREVQGRADLPAAAPSQQPN